MDHPLLLQMQNVGLWPDEETQRQSLAELANRLPDQRALARELVHHELLTPLQANKLVSNQADALRVGSYILMERIGEGGMGQVYKAKHTRLHKVVALKIIRPEKMGSRTAQERFYREIRAVARLQHGNIVWAFDADRDERNCYFAMQYVPGPNLSRLVKLSGPLPVRQACDFIRQAAMGLQHIAENGMIHRDIKPSNILLTRHPDEPGEGAIVAKIADLGLMRIHDDVAGASAMGALTQVGVFIGTPDYIAPEQARDSKEVDIRSDIYSLGCTLYYILTGKPPFAGDSAVEKIMKHQLEEPEPLVNIRSDIPTGLPDVLRKMMEKKREDRYQTPIEAVNALAQFCREAPPQAVPAQAVPVAAHPVPIAGDDEEDAFQFGGQAIVGSDVSGVYANRRKTSASQIPLLKIALLSGIGILSFVFLLWLIFR